MSKQILKDLPELLGAGIISQESAQSIRNYYERRAQASPNRLIMVFGILGALLIGLGIILIIAHNWDNLSKGVKLFFALLPLFTGQAVCGYTLFKNNHNAAWREACAVFLFFAIAASISIVSQVYNIHGTLSGFLLTWMLLSIPVVYLMQSAMSSLLVICGITAYACDVSYFESPTPVAWYYWLMLASLIPFLIRLSKPGARNFFTFHLWFLTVSVIIALGMFDTMGGEYVFISYISLLSLLILLGGMKPFSEGGLISNAFLVAGSLGMAILLLILTFEGLWSDISKTNPAGIDAIASFTVSFLAGGLLVFELRRKGIAGVNPTGFVFFVFILLFFLGVFEPQLAQWLTNVLVLSIAFITTWRGAQQDNIVILNYGLLIMTALIICRFFDTDVSFVIRGILFMATGVSFFAANYWIIKKRKLQNI